MIDLERLRTELDYNPDTGVFVWKTARQGQPIKGSVAGVVDKSTGFLKIGWNNRVHYGHRLAWMYVHGEIPRTIAVKQRNEDRADCRLANLYTDRLKGRTRSTLTEGSSANIARRSGREASA